MDEPPATAPSPSFSPLYQQIKASIVQQIASGEWTAGNPIPSETDLARRFGVSQGTVRKAIETLAAEHLLVRRQGKGTFVASHEEPRAQFRFLRLRTDDGHAPTPVSEILDCRRVRVPADVGRTLRTPSGSTVLSIRRLMRFDDLPVILEDIWLAGPEFRQLTAERIAGHQGALYALFEAELGTKMIRASEKVRAVAANDGQARGLGVARGAPLLQVERVTSTFRDRPVEMRRGVYRTDRHHYSNELL